MASTDVLTLQEAFFHHDGFMPNYLCLFLFLIISISSSVAEDNNCYELRVYTAAEGKLEELHNRFKNHTCKLFEKHGFKNIGYWVPADKSDNRLFYVISSPNRKAHNQSFTDFLNDPEWKKASRESIKNGRLVAKIESTFLKASDYSPQIEPAITKNPRIFELRTYTTEEGRLNNLNARFRDHTCKLFEKHGMKNIAYWTPSDKNKGSSNTLIYIISHKNQAQAKENWKGFISDPNWKKARAESVKDGKILAVAPEKIFLNAVDYSPTK